MNVPGATEAADRPRWVRSLGVGAGLLLVALVAARASSAYIGAAFPDRPLPRDLLFEMLPHVAQLGYVADIALLAALALLGAYALRGNQREIPTMMALFGLMELSRAIINVLTPLASPLRHSAYYGINLTIKASTGVIHFSQNGEFPSGHMASVFLCMLLVDKVKSPRIRAALAVLVVVEAFALLMSHQHYSIDVVGGLLLSYVIYHEYAEGTWFDWLKPLVKV